MAAPAPPTHGPNKMLNVAGANTCGQNLTPNIIRGKAVQSAPIPAYTAAFTAVSVNSRDKDLEVLCDG